MVVQRLAWDGEKGGALLTSGAEVHFVPLYPNHYAHAYDATTDISAGIENCAVKGGRVFVHELAYEFSADVTQGPVYLVCLAGDGEAVKGKLQTRYGMLLETYASGLDVTDSAFVVGVWQLSQLQASGGTVLIGEAVDVPEGAVFGILLSPSKAGGHATAGLKVHALLKVERT